MKKIYYFFFLLFFQFAFAAYATEPFRFALFSDLHISTTNSIPSEDLQNAVIDVNKLQNVDFVIISGDVSNLGDTLSLRMAKHMLQKLNMPYYIIPGNHDVKWYESGDTNFRAIFGDTKFVFIHNGIEFVGLTTAPLNRSGLGHIQQEDINWMKTILEKAGRKEPSFVVTHYPLQTGDVDNWKDMANVLREYNVLAVLGGHYHRNVLLNYGGIPGIVSRSTLRAKDKVGGYSLFTVSDSIKVSEKRIGEQEELWLNLPINSERK
jgi:3',5'-cyclic AMP phosphodiesterase CpdA